ncbi:MAG: GNAT family N-acetyltransferase [Chloroflexota bacterium]
MSASRRIRTTSTDQLSAEEFSEINALCEAAFRFPFAGVWERVGQGIHVLAHSDGGLVAHAMIVDRRIFTGPELDVTLDAAYVENVATHPEAQGEGHGSAVMAEAGRIIQEEYEIGALGTRDQGFYRGLGWVVWAGSTFVRTPDGERIRTGGVDGEVMVLRTPRTPLGIALEEPIAIDWRPGEPW